MKQKIKILVAAYVLMVAVLVPAFPLVARALNASAAAIELLSRPALMGAALAVVGLAWLVADGWHARQGTS